MTNVPVDKSVGGSILEVTRPKDLIVQSLASEERTKSYQGELTETKTFGIRTIYPPSHKKRKKGVRFEILNIHVKKAGSYNAETW